MESTDIICLAAVNWPISANNEMGNVTQFHRRCMVICSEQHFGDALDFCYWQEDLSLLFLLKTKVTVLPTCTHHRKQGWFNFAHTITTQKVKNKVLKSMKIQFSSLKNNRVLLLAWKLVASMGQVITEHIWRQESSVLNVLLFNVFIFIISIPHDQWRMK